jgi:hypothetical protein
MLTGGGGSRNFLGGGSTNFLGGARLCRGRITDRE